MFFLIQLYEMYMEPLDDAPPKNSISRKTKLFKILVISNPKLPIIKLAKRYDG